MGLESEEGHTMIWRWVSVTYAVRFGKSKQAKRRLWRAICQRMSQLGSTGYYGHMNTSKSFEVKVLRSNLDSLAWLFFSYLRNEALILTSIKSTLPDWWSVRWKDDTFTTERDLPQWSQRVPSQGSRAHCISPWHMSWVVLCAEDWVDQNKSCHDPRSSFDGEHLQKSILQRLRAILNRHVDEVEN